MSTLKVTVPTLQNVSRNCIHYSLFDNIKLPKKNSPSQVFQDDTANIQFGKYTLFSAYASTANAKMSPISFAILFGGKTTENWSLFWKFTVKTHPSINCPEITIISDQNMGCIAALANHVPQAHHFHCAWHWCQNIIKTCGGSVSTPGNAL